MISLLLDPTSMSSLNIFYNKEMFFPLLNLLSFLWFYEDFQDSQSKLRSLSSQWKGFLGILLGIKSSFYKCVITTLLSRRDALHKEINQWVSLNDFSNTLKRSVKMGLINNQTEAKIGVLDLQSNLVLEVSVKTSPNLSINSRVSPIDPKASSFISKSTGTAGR